MSGDLAKEKLKRINTDLGGLYKAQPELMGAFGSVVSVATKDGALSTRTKELMAVSISIATRCEECIVYHLDKALKLGASRDEVLDTIAVAIEMGGGPCTVYGAKALRLFDELDNTRT